jgi:hypothetical protein
VAPVATVVQLVDPGTRRWRLTWRLARGFPLSCSYVASMATRRGAVKVTDWPVRMVEAELVSPRVVLRRAHVEYLVDQVGTLYLRCSVATSQRPYAWAFQPLLGLLRVYDSITASR